MVGKPKPKLQALVLADYIHLDRATKKKYILGTFDLLSSSEFPSELQQISYAFVCLTEIRDKTDVLIQYVDLSDFKVLLKTKTISIQAKDPLLSVAFVLPVPPIPMPHDGHFAFEVHCDGEQVGSLRITVEQKKV